MSIWWILTCCTVIAATLRDTQRHCAEFDAWLPGFMQKMRADDVLMITADHGCDPSYTKTTDHTREYVPYLIYGASVRGGIDLGTRVLRRHHCQHGV